MLSYENRELYLYSKVVRCVLTHNVVLIQSCNPVVKRTSTWPLSVVSRILAMPCLFLEVSTHSGLADRKVNNLHRTHSIHSTEAEYYSVQNYVQYRTLE